MRNARAVQGFPLTIGRCARALQKHPPNCSLDRGGGGVIERLSGRGGSCSPQTGPSDLMMVHQTPYELTTHCQSVPGLVHIDGWGPSFPVHCTQHHKMVYCMQPSHRAQHCRNGPGPATFEQT